MEEQELPESAVDAQVEQLNNQLLRLQADFENARKRWAKERAEIQEISNLDILRQLLEIHDDFQRAMAAAGAEKDGNFYKGVEMIARRVELFLKSYGITPIDAEGKPFDPMLHEAVAHEASDAVPEATVLEELRKGYWMNGKVLRHSVVKVSTTPE